MSPRGRSRSCAAADRLKHAVPVVGRLGWSRAMGMFGWGGSSFSALPDAAAAPTDATPAADASETGASPDDASFGPDAEGAPGDGSSARPVDGGADAGSSRSFALASGGVELRVTAPLGLQIPSANLADDGDAIEIHQEFYGIPWAAFEAGAAPPTEWTALMDSLASAAKGSGKPIFLSLSMLNGGRDHLAAKTVIQNGEVKTQDGWSTPCYDFRAAPDGAARKQAYLDYVAWMVDEFSPRWLNVAVEVNLFFE